MLACLGSLSGRWIVVLAEGVSKALVETVECCLQPRASVATTGSFAQAGNQPTIKVADGGMTLQDSQDANQRGGVLLRDRAWA